MKNKSVFKLIIFIVILIIIGLVMFFIKENRYMDATMSGVVVRVNENSLSVMKIGDTNDLTNVSYADEGNIGFKVGQEVLIHFDGMVAYSYPAQIHRVGKIEIVKEQSEAQIPDKVLKYYYNSRNKVTVAVKELTNKGISLSITDTNDIPYTYSNEYTIRKLVKNKNYTNSTGYYTMGDDSTNSIPGYIGPDPEYVFEDMEKISKISTEDTVISSEKINDSTIVKTYDWTRLYGKLGERRI